MKHLSDEMEHPDSQNEHLQAVLYHLHLWLRFERDTVDRFTLRLVCHLRIDLRGADVLVAEHVLNGIDARSGIDL